MQLVDRFPLDMLQTKFPAIRFREPRDHLPAVAAKLAELDGVDGNTRFLGLSYIDNDLLGLLARDAGGNVSPVDYSSLPGWRNDAGLETIQSLLTDPQTISRIKGATGAVDVVSARFILEHAESAIAFLKSVTGLVRPGGYIVIEVPDAEKMLAAGNHALIWEDHFTYFTVDSLTDLVSRTGATLVDIGRYPYAYEDALVAIIRIGDGRDASGNNTAAAMSAGVREKFSGFTNGFAVRKHGLRIELENLLAGGERLAVFGAGHHAAKYINFYGIEDLFDCVIDDSPAKAGLYMPGTGLCIRTSEYLMDSAVTTCLSTLAPDTERRVRQSLAGFFGRGGKFIPTFNLAGVHDDK